MEIAGGSRDWVVESEDDVRVVESEDFQLVGYDDELVLLLVKEGNLENSDVVGEFTHVDFFVSDQSFLDLMRPACLFTYQVFSK